MTGFDGWTSSAIALVERAIVVHGGMHRWKETASVRLPFGSGSGSLLRLKGYRHSFPAPREYEIRPHQCVTLFHGYPDEHHRGRFSDGSVSIERVEGGEAPLVSTDHRRTFSGVAKYRRWSPLDALYFFGYALWHYHVLPFTLGEARLVRVFERQGVPEGVDVVFPDHVHTHCRQQRFYFGADGRIVRHDYVADVIGSWASGAHFWEDYRRCSGLLIARRRRIVVRLGRRPIPIPVLCVQLGEPLLSLQSPQECVGTPDD